MSEADNMASNPRRAKCPGCGYSMRLRKDGTVQEHLLYFGWNDRRYCSDVFADRHENAASVTDRALPQGERAMEAA